MIKQVLTYFEGHRVKVRVDIDTVTDQHTILTIEIDDRDMTHSTLINQDTINKIARG
jgi:hypothetical protein